jgi:hypothetical protein
MVRMLKENRPLKFFTVPSDRLKEFAKEGKKRGLLYVVIKDKKNPSQCEIMVFADDAAKVNRVMDRMNLDFLRSESGEAVHEVEQEAEHTAGAQTESVELPEGEVEFELGDLETDFGFGDDAAEPGNFTQAQEERNPSGPSSRSSGTFTGQESPDAPEKPSVREELAKIKKEKQEAGKEKARTKNRSRNRAAGRKKKKSKVKAKMKLKGR